VTGRASGDGRNDPTGSCVDESQNMAVFRVVLTDDEQRLVNAERDFHPVAHVRRKMPSCGCCIVA
jgi:hypothetical protein